MRIAHRITLGGCGSMFDALRWLLEPFFGQKTLLEVFDLVLAGQQNFDLLHNHV